jgi:Zn finger protein HypA/HybF involved in hydrogenase expression
MEKRTLTISIVLFLIIVLSASITYAGTSLYYKQILNNNRINSNQFKNSPIEESIEESTELRIEKEEKGISCNDCHGTVKNFHNVEDITKLDELKNRTPRICTTCHGVSIHGIHEALLDKGTLDCTGCHNFVGEKINVPKVREGDILVCEQCHYDGNYIEIHITRGTGTCSSCHVGSVGRIHQPTMANIEELLGKGGKAE